MRHTLLVRLAPVESFSKEKTTTVDSVGVRGVEEAVDADIQAFAQFFSDTLKNDRLTKAEHAILKTYLGWKLGVFRQG